jgi:hypothetical protein
MKCHSAFVRDWVQAHAIVRVNRRRQWLSRTPPPSVTTTGLFDDTPSDNAHVRVPSILLFALELLLSFRFRANAR